MLLSKSAKPWIICKIYEVFARNSFDTKGLSSVINLYKHLVKRGRRLRSCTESLVNKSYIERKENVINYYQIGTRPIKKRKLLFHFKTVEVLYVVLKKEKTRKNISKLNVLYCVVSA